MQPCQNLNFCCSDFQSTFFDLLWDKKYILFWSARFVVICFGNSRILIHMQILFPILTQVKGILGMWRLSMALVPSPAASRWFASQGQGTDDTCRLLGGAEASWFVDVLFKNDVGDRKLLRIWSQSPKTLVEGSSSWKELFVGELLRSGSNDLSFRESVKMLGRT